MYYRFINETFEKLFSLKIHDKIPLFIIGPPRSGSTLLYQYLARYFDVSYFNNYHHKNYMCPSFAELKKNSLKKTNNYSFSSYYGFTKGEFSPSESWDFWYRFFRRTPHYVDLKDISLKDINRMKNAVNSFINITKNHLLIKNLTCTTRIKPLINAFPNSYWIISYRNILSNAYSIAKMRLELNNDLCMWESVQPEGYEDFIKSKYEIQIFKQLELIYETIISDLKGYRDRVSFVNYEDFCNEPNLFAENLHLELKSAGIHISKKNDNLPKSFNPSTNFEIRDKIFKTIFSQYEINKEKFKTQFQEMNKIFSCV